YIYVGKEFHFDQAQASALTSFAASAFHIERKPPGFITPDFSLRQLGKQIAYLRKNTGIGSRIRSRCPANRRLVYLYYFVEKRQPFNLFVGKRLGSRAIEFLVE